LDTWNKECGTDSLSLVEESFLGEIVGEDETKFLVVIEDPCGAFYVREVGGLVGVRPGVF
jgi:hypothetical protein